MQQDERSSAIEVDARQSSAFVHPLRVRVLMLCALEECSLLALQQRIDAPLAKLHYHVGRLLAAGLLTVSRTQRRAGRAIKFYRAVADSFIVPHENLPALPGDKLSEQLRQSLRDEHLRNGELSLVYSPAPGGKMLVKLIAQEPAAPSRGLELWRMLKLDAGQRTALAAELAEIFERYAEEEQRPGAQTLLVHAAFAPRLQP